MVRKFVKFLVVFSLIVVFLFGFILYQPLQSENEIQTYLARSVPYVGADIPRMDGIDGTGIKAIGRAHV